MAQVYRFRRSNWQNWYEIFCVCRSCHRPTVFLVGLHVYEAQEKFYSRDGLVDFSGDLGQYFEIERFISLRDNVPMKPPEHVEGDIKNAFTEGAACLSIECYNAAATMFRLCVDLATKPLLPDPADGSKPEPNDQQRRVLGYRLKWLFENDRLTSDLRGLAHCIKEEGNDGAHVETLTKEDVEDLLDFTFQLLERLITLPENLKLVEKRRQARRSPSSASA